MHGLDYVAFRYFNVYAIVWISMDVNTEVLIRWMERLRRGCRGHLGDGQQTWTLSMCGCCSGKYSRAKAKFSDEVFNVASGTETSLVQLAALLAS